ncbi:hypothetical protein EU99_0914 [Prochlorococcus marinus str. MIT 9321]|uniref:Uncharacterized protein n=1 Tax=Prochlorococcus marinus str. MIT 9401 TaxID=167551 RepID=A0A0A2B3Y7_PROMR|nr:hypothetical protein EU99_0914 [Prochlorococcus marinus str. MIT 9321]KGG04926.1 hypothetical protein EV00_1961 [Prochlorococcus marinus str. MIT 9322]KGG07862.1 hypothetical protein EV01_0940 [Prochlorococcus marinus str. MIT 9401]
MYIPAFEILIIFFNQNNLLIRKILLKGVNFYLNKDILLHQKSFN